MFRYTPAAGCGDIVKAAPLTPHSPYPGPLPPPTPPPWWSHKCCDHIPLRQEGIFAHHNIPVSRATLGDWVIKPSQVVIPLFNLCEENLLAGRFMRRDETPLQVLAETGRAYAKQEFGRKALMDRLEGWFGEVSSSGRTIRSGGRL